MRTKLRDEPVREDLNYVPFTSCWKRYVAWPDELMKAWSEAVAVIAPNANHAFDSKELLNFTEEDHRFLDAVSAAASDPEDSAYRTAIYLICKALAGRIGTTSTKHKRLVLSKFNPLIFSLTRVERFCETADLIVTAPDGISKKVT